MRANNEYRPTSWAGAWINPVRQSHWRQTTSIEMTREMLEGRMYPLTLAGLDDAIDALS